MDLSKKIFKYLSLTLIALALYFFLNYLFTPIDFTVTGIGEVSVPTTTTSLVVTLSETDSDQNTIRSNLSLKVQKFKSLLENFNADPQSHREGPVTLVPQSSTGPETTESGYRGTVTLAAKLNGPQNIPQLTSYLYDQGAAFVSKPALEAENSQEWEEKAYDAALADADQKADTMSKKYGAILKKKVAISPQSASDSQVNRLLESKTLDNTLKITRQAEVTYRFWLSR